MVTIDGRGAKWLAAGLLLSLALIVFLGGLVAGRILGGSSRQVASAPAAAPGRGGNPPQFVGPIARLASGLPDDQRPAFLHAIEPHRGALASAGQDVREARVKLSEATLAEPFNRAGFIAAATQLDARAQAERKAFYEALGDGLAVLPLDVRRDILEAARPGRDRQGQRRLQQ